MTTLLSTNPERARLPLSDRQAITVFQRSIDDFPALPIYHRGQSKEIRKTSVPGILIQRLIPSLSSITQKTKGVISGTERLRHSISVLFWNRLHEENIPTCYIAHQGEFTLLVEQRIPPVEVIMKASIVGTPARVYHDLFSKIDRFGKPFVENMRHAPYIRFDYRNPLQNGEGEFLRDECMPVALANRLIDIRKAENQALRVFGVIEGTLERIGLQLLDGCLILDDTGTVVCSEISPDNLRIKSKNWKSPKGATHDFDKDLWRKGVPDEIILGQWQSLKRKLDVIC